MVIILKPCCPALTHIIVGVKFIISQVSLYVWTLAQCFPLDFIFCKSKLVLIYFLDLYVLHIFPFKIVEQFLTVFLSRRHPSTTRFPWPQGRKRRPRFPRARWHEGNPRTAWHTWITRTKRTPWTCRTRNERGVPRSARKKGYGEASVYHHSCLLLSPLDKQGQHFDSLGLCPQVRWVSQGSWVSLDYQVVLDPQGFLEGKDFLEGPGEMESLADQDTLD